MASIIGTLASAFFEIDEIEASRVGDEVHYTFITTGVLPSLAELKTKFWALVAPPVRRLEIIDIQEVEAGPIAKRYKIHVKGKVIGKTLGERKYRIFPLKHARR